MAHNDKYANDLDSDLIIEYYDESGPKGSREEWENRESHAWNEFKDRMKEDFSGAYFDPEDLAAVHLRYVPDDISHCPHCDNLRRNDKGEKERKKVEIRNKRR